MRLLLDTHAFIWWDQGVLAKSVVRRIQRADEVYVSAATAWEIAIKASLGRLEAPRVAEVLADYDFHELPISVQHSDAVRDLPPLHRDPFDRILVAQAREESLTLISRDPLVRAYDVTIAWD